MSYYTDADIEMHELAEAGDMIHRGVCPTCTEPLDPTAPKWARTAAPRRRHADGTYSVMSHADWAASVGPHGTVLGGFHDSCARDMMGEGDLDDWSDES